MSREPRHEQTDVEALVDRLPVAVCRTTPDGRILFANHALRSLLQVGPSEDVVGRQIQDFYIDDQVGGSHREMAMTSGGIGPEEVEFRAATGSTIWVKLLANPVYEDGRVVFIEGTLEDVTEQRRTREELAASEARFRTAFENAPIGMLMSASGDTAVRANQAYLDMLGMDAEQFHATSLENILGPEALADSRRRIAELAEGKMSRYENERKMSRADGSQILALTRVSAVREPDGTLSSVLAQAVDITEKRKVRDRLQDLVRSKDELVRSVSHELRTPLTTIVGLAAELDQRAEDFSEEDRAEYLRLIAEQSAEMGDLINDLLVAAHAESGLVEIRAEPVDVVHEAKAVIGAWREGPVSLEADSTDATAFADPFRVRQIVRNLLTNAFKHGRPPVSVVVAHNESDVVVTVRDAGPALPESEWGSIFDPYYSARPEPGVTGSVGLGLTLSRNLAALMGGDLTYRSHDGSSELVLTLLRRAPAGRAPRAAT
jgi:PAS domain S-box-containing protein